ncbi:MAG: hypothetical protein JXX29_17700 [Deltaproteobacteria bacterium]|nr:hypothetical protein [Deltaproteobacteria bacterium]MBN2673520.1 hypothetical protein [Deltaproteobacteria bacterium]
MTDIMQSRKKLQQAMNIAPAISGGIEDLLGRSANGMTFVAGRKLGKQMTESAKKTTDIHEALEETRRVLVDNHCLWHFEPFKPSSQSELVKQTDKGLEVMLVFRDCMIRQSLFRYGHPQEGSLCFMMYGFFSGALENIMGKKTELQIVHSGENACLKRLTIEN